MTTDESPSSPNNGTLNRLACSIAAIEDGLLVFLLAAMIGLAGSQVLLRLYGSPRASNAPSHPPVALLPAIPQPPSRFSG